MSEERKKINPTVIIILLFFIVFVSLYFTQITNLYQYKEHTKMSVTKEAIEKFEKDLAEGKNIEIENYLENTIKDYSNGISKLGNKTSKIMESIMTDGIKTTFKLISALFT